MHTPSPEPLFSSKRSVKDIKLPEKKDFSGTWLKPSGLNPPASANTSAAKLDDAKSLRVKAVIAMSAKRYEEAQSMLEEAYRLLSELYGKDHVECVKTKKNLDTCQQNISNAHTNTEIPW